ncbi:MAG: aminotransferase [Acidimicrobiales bacterium]|jgi:hypothetical protein|nr:aminotransferase [Acidimicrobiales bacterium]
MRIQPRVEQIWDPPVAAARAWVADRVFPADRPLLDLGQAAPGYPPAAELRAHVAEVIRRDDSAGYTPAAGLPHVRAAVADHLGGVYGAALDPAQVLVSAGCNEAFCLAIDALAGPGDEVVLPVPFYFNHDMWLRARGVTPVYLPCEPADGLIPDPTRLDGLLTTRTRAVVLVTPNNPTGVDYPAHVVEAFRDRCAARGVALLVDETYRAFRADDDPPHGLLADPGWDDTVVVLTSFSKSLALAGYRAGALVGHPDLVRVAVRLADCVTICAPRPAQEAVAFGLGQLDGWMTERRVDLLDRVERFRSALAGSDAGYELLASGAFFAYVRHPFHGETAERVACRLAVEQGVLTIPGERFGPGQDRCLRLAFGNLAGAQIDAAVERLDPR